MATILIIEDDDIVRKLIRKILMQEGHEVLEADDGQAGSKLAQASHPDLIVCDVMMPKMNGYQVLELLQGDRETKTIPFVFLTAKSEKHDMRQGMQLGADDYLTKPFTKNELLGAITTRLSKLSSLQKKYADEAAENKLKLSQLAGKDPLTNLPNQLALRDVFNGILERKLRAFPGKGAPHQLQSKNLVSVFCLGLERFSRITETFGYDLANLLLKAISDRLKTTVAGAGSVIRLTGNDFCVLLDPLEHKQEITSIAEKLVLAFKQPFPIETQDIFIAISIGISLYPRDNLDIGKLLRSANKAMLQARNLGGNQYQFFTAALNVGKSNLVTLETDLRYALERNEFEVHYQPKMDLQSGKITGAEALLRWYHPQRGAVSPVQFIPLAEETGLIEEIGEFVLQEACKQLNIWQTNGLKNFRMSVNLSARQFNQLNLHQRLSRILIENNIDSQDLELELTESTLVQNSEVAVRRLKALKTLGLSIAIDDFGTGYSSLSYLQQFPFDKLKIDRSFVHNIHANRSNSAIITAIISMAHQLGLKVIAEGVENQAELEFLKRHGCDEMQGFLFSYPVSAKEFESSPFVSASFESDLVQ
ncbi:MAG: EAL domain-containing protein [Limnothrix sp. RL_2_0]|nr:EAL domain-containing protein [Limnothrix sp. RL_2_0]